MGPSAQLANKPYLTLHVETPAYLPSVENYTCSFSRSRGPMCEDLTGFYFLSVHPKAQSQMATMKILQIWPLDKKWDYMSLSYISANIGWCQCHLWISSHKKLLYAIKIFKILITNVTCNYTIGMWIIYNFQKKFSVLCCSTAPRFSFNPPLFGSRK
jgi:hypothetical protein